MMSTVDTTLNIDDIFTLLKETRAKEQKFDKTESEKKNNSNVLYEEIKKKVSHLPTIEAHVVTKNTKDLGKNKQRGVQKIDDSVESVLPDMNQKTVTDRRLLKEERSMKWFSLPKVEMTDDIKRDLVIIKNRKYLDPKRCYRGEKWEIPQNFQVGEIVEGVGEYAGRIGRKKRGKTLTDEILKDEKAKEWFGKTYSEIQKKKSSGGKNFLKDKINKRKKY